MLLDLDLGGAVCTGKALDWRGADLSWGVVLPRGADLSLVSFSMLSRHLHRDWRYSNSFSQDGNALLVSCSSKSLRVPGSRREHTRWIMNCSDNDSTLRFMFARALRDWLTSLIRVRRSDPDSLAMGSRWNNWAMCFSTRTRLFSYSWRRAFHRETKVSSADWMKRALPS